MEFVRNSSFIRLAANFSSSEIGQVLDCFEIRGNKRIYFCNASIAWLLARSLVSTGQLGIMGETAEHLSPRCATCASVRLSFVTGLRWSRQNLSTMYQEAIQRIHNPFNTSHFPFLKSGECSERLVLKSLPKWN